MAEVPSHLASFQNEKGSEAAALPRIPLTPPDPSRSRSVMPGGPGRPRARWPWPRPHPHPAQGRSAREFPVVPGELPNK